MAHLLVVEDDRDLLEAMVEILGNDGHQVTATSNGREALAAFEHQPPDLILSDLMMPEMDGYALLEAVRAQPAGAATLFLLLSARTARADVGRARDLGADDYLFKPFTAAELVRAVRVKLERRRAVEAFNTQAAHLQTVTLLTNLVEARDRHTAGHLERVQGQARSLGQALGWSPEALAILEFGALLHDIGKIEVPRLVLNKPGPLVPDEWHIVRQHPETGARILEGVDHLRPALPYVRHHHERWDGRGYPAGLAGEEIPREGRLLAIVDAYDAMTSVRPYRAQLSPDAAMDEIRGGAGHQFDPGMAAVFYELHRTPAGAADHLPLADP
jgi:putative two-component system response regulator